MLLLGSLVAGGQAEAGQAQAVATVGGIVVARDTGRPVSEATVTVEGTERTTVTNALGRFELTGIPVARAVLIVRAPGYLDLRVPDVQVQPGDGTRLFIELNVTPNFLETVQVTATKQALSVGDVAAQTTIIDRQTIERRGDQRLTQAIEHVPGAVITTQLGVFESVLLRGMPRMGNEFTNTLLLIDGVPQTNSGNDARVVALPINDARSIEVVRGPTSALYGRTAIGGAVNVLTAEPAAAPEVAIDLTGGQFGTAKGVFAATGPVSEWGGYYVSVASERTGGYWNNLLDPDFKMGNTALFGKLKFVPDSRSFGSITVNRVISENSTPTNEPVIDGELLHRLDPRFERFTSFNIPGPNYRQQEGRATLNYMRELAPWLRFVETFGYRTVQLAFVEDGDFIGEPYNLANATVTMYPFSQQADENIYYQEARLELSWTQRMRHALTFGGSYERNNGRLASDFIFTDDDLFGFPDISYLNPVLPGRNEWQHFEGRRTYNLGITGLFGQYIAEPLPRLVVTLSGRYDRLSMDVTRAGGPLVEQTFSAFSPKVSATVRLLTAGADGPALNAYGAYSQSFLPPRRPSALTPADVPLNLQPVDIDNYEGGLKGSLLGGRLALEATYFQMTEDGVVINRRQGAFFVPTNAGERKYKGFETGADWGASDRVSTFLNASFYRNRFGTFVIEGARGETVLTGNRLRISPDYVMNWGVNVMPVRDVDLTFDVKRMSDVMGNDDNTYRLDAYTVADAAVTWRRGALRVTLSAHNLFDTAYYWNGDGESADPGAPRQVLLSTSIRLR